MASWGGGEAPCLLRLQAARYAPQHDWGSIFASVELPLLFSINDKGEEATLQHAARRARLLTPNEVVPDGA